MKLERQDYSYVWDIDVKRFGLPYVLTGECPKCGNPIRRDFCDSYLSYPVIGKPIENTLYCCECDHEWDIQLRLDVTMSLVEPASATPSAADQEKREK